MPNKAGTEAHQAETEAKGSKNAAQSTVLQELFYSSKDDEFKEYRYFLQPQKDKTSAPSANETKTVIGLKDKDIIKKNNEEDKQKNEKDSKQEAGKASKEDHNQEKIIIITDNIYDRLKKEKKIRKYTIKKASTIGGTLAEVASQMRLSRLRDQKSIQEEKKHTQSIGEDNRQGREEKTEHTTKNNPRYAKSFLVTALTSEGSENYKIATPGQTIQYFAAEDFIKNLYAASRWQPVAYAINASKLLGIGKRQRGAGTLSPELFMKIRQLNKKYNLGLEYIAHGAGVTADLDLHLDNCLLNFDISRLDEGNQTKAFQLIQNFDDLFDKESGKPTDKQKYFDCLITFIEEMQKLGTDNNRALIYFHKIDHDSGLYRFCDEERQVLLRDHGTSMTHVGVVNKRPHIRMQPTNHIAELLADCIDPKDFILTHASIDSVISNPISKQVDDSMDAIEEFFTVVQEQCEISVSGTSEQLRAQLMLLKHFEHHITSGYKLEVAVGKELPGELQSQINIIKQSIKDKMKEATIVRGIALHKEYLDFIGEYAEINQSKKIQPKKTSEENKSEQQIEEVNIEHFKNFLDDDINEEVCKKIFSHKGNILSEYKKRWFFFMNDAEHNKGKEIESIIAQSNAYTDLNSEQMIEYLNNEKYKNHSLYKIISKNIGEKCMPLYRKSAIQQFREGLAGIRKYVFWGGLILTGAALLGGAAIALSIFTGGLAVPLLIPAVVSIVGGVGLGSTTLAAATNPATYRWFRTAPLPFKIGFIVGVVAVLAAATILTGGAALAIVGAISVAAGVLTLLGLKASASVTATAAVAAKATTLTVGAAEGAGFAAKTMIKSTNTKKIAQGLGSTLIAVEHKVAVGTEPKSENKAQEVSVSSSYSFTPSSLPSTLPSGSGGAGSSVLSSTPSQESTPESPPRFIV